MTQLPPWQEPTANTTPPRTSLGYALRYAQMGWHVFPIAPRKKTPLTTHGFKDATTDPAAIKAYWEQWPEAGIGVAMEASGLFAVDVDPRNGGEAGLENLVEHGRLPDTVEAITGGGGTHYIFNRPSSGLKKGPLKVFPGVDIQADGSYIIVEPSIHPSGTAYTWEASSDPLDGVAVMDAPKWLLDIVGGKPNGSSKKDGFLFDASKVALPHSGTPEQPGNRNPALASLVGQWCHENTTPEAILSKALTWNQRNSPPLAITEVVQTTQSIINGHNERNPSRAVVFKPEPAPEQDHLITKQASLWGNSAVPERDWLLPDWIPMRQTAALYARGGTGKTLMAQQLITCVSTGNEFMGMQAKQGPTLGIFCEDDDESLHMRQADINKALGLSWGDLSGVHIASRVGHDNLLMTFDGRDSGTLTPFWHELHEQVQAIKPTLLVVDTAADTFGGNENNRPQVRQYVQQALTRIATECNCAVLLCAHPSLSGINSGEGTGGSTAWENSVRSRFYMDRDDDTGVLSLTRKKSNYSKAGDAIEMVWQEGALIPFENAAADFIENHVEKRQERFFLAQLFDTERRGIEITPSPNSSSYAPRMIVKLAKKYGEKYTVPQMKDTMERLILDGSIYIEEDQKRKVRKLKIREEII